MERKKRKVRGLAVGDAPLDDAATLNLFDTAHFVSTTDQYLCPVCKNVLNEPQVANNATNEEEECLHVYCLHCVRSALKVKEECPLHRRALTFSQLSPVTFLKGKIGGLDVQCVLHERGCNWTGTFGRQGKRLREHLDTCAYVIVGCSHDACEQHMPRANKPSHEAECGKRPTPCPLCELVLCADAHTTHKAEVCPKVSVVCKECGTSVIRGSIQAHVSEKCPHRSIQCPLGCSIRADQLTQHMQNAAAQHIAALCERLNKQDYTSLRARLNKQRVDIPVLNQRLDKLRASHASLKQDHTALKKRRLGCLQADVAFDFSATRDGNVSLFKDVRLAKMVVQCKLRFTRQPRLVGFYSNLQFPVPCTPGPFTGSFEVTLLGEGDTVEQTEVWDPPSWWRSGKARAQWGGDIGTLAPGVDSVVFRLRVTFPGLSI